MAQFKDRNKAIDVVPISQIVSSGEAPDDVSDGTQDWEGGHVLVLGSQDGSASQVRR